MDTEHSFEHLFEQSSDAAFVADPLEDRVLAANPAGCALLGYTLEELLATPISRVHPADMPLLRTFVEDVLREGQGSTVKLTCRTKDGTFLPVEMSLVALESGRRGRILALLRDRSEHRQRRRSD
jgi:PAS domain S-box-containing protein